MNFPRTATLLALALAPLACTVADTPAQQEADFTEAQLVVLLDDNDYRYTGIAAADGLVYIAHGVRGVDVRSAQTLELVETFSFTRDREVLVEADTGVQSAEGQLRIVADGVEMDDEDLIVWGVRDDSPLDPFGGAPFVPKKLVVQSFTPDHQLAWRLNLVLDRNWRVPSLGVSVDDGRVHVSVGHEEWGNRVVTVDVPSEGEDVTTDLLDGEGTTALMLDELYPQGITAHAGNIYLPAGRDGLVAISDGEATTVGDTEAFSYVVGLAHDGDRMFVADHDLGFHIMSSNGDTMLSTNVDDYVTGIAVADGTVFVSTFTGVYVAPQTN